MRIRGHTKPYIGTVLSEEEEWQRKRQGIYPGSFLYSGYVDITVGRERRHPSQWVMGNVHFSML